ncbi:hypothetical protein ACC807_37870, partial [Rhizobium ruizarguesonis]
MSDEVANMQKAVLAAFGSREVHLAWQMLALSGSGQPCDITFYNRGPIIDTKISERISIARMYGAGASQLR